MNFIFRFGREELLTRDSAVEYCRSVGLIPQEKKCVHCRKTMLFRKSKACRGLSREWRCVNTRCPKYQFSISGRNGTWFSDSKMPIEKIMLITFCFCKGYSNSDTLEHTAIFTETTSTETICDWFTYCLEVCCDIVSEHSRPIGGPGFTVEIDEGKFGKRKFNRGRYVDGQWVFGGICRETKDVFLIPVGRRDRETLLPLILKNILPGTTIISDCWRAYSILGEIDYNHLTVNHSINFVDPDTGAYTQTIESTWWQIKRKLPETHTRHGRLHLYLGHYLFNSISRKNNSEPFDFFINYISQIKW